MLLFHLTHFTFAQWYIEESEDIQGKNKKSKEIVKIMFKCNLI